MITHLCLIHSKKAHNDNFNLHSLIYNDGGYQYTSSAFINMLNQSNMAQNISIVHCCIDNGVC